MLVAGLGASGRNECLVAHRDDHGVVPAFEVAVRPFLLARTKLHIDDLPADACICSARWLENPTSILPLPSEVTGMAP